MSVWQWPQFAEAGILILAVVVSISKHGEARPAYNGPSALICACIIAWILYMGGFWS